MLPDDAGLSATATAGVAGRRIEALEPDQADRGYSDLLYGEDKRGGDTFRADEARIGSEKVRDLLAERHEQEHLRRRP